MVLKAFWLLSSNFGDNLNHYILSRMSTEKICYVDIKSKERKLVCIGSILNWCDENSIAWGCGIADLSQHISSGTKIIATRGPLSRQRAVQCGCTVPEIYGDPALLLPFVYSKPKASKKKYKLGIIPHYVDQYKIISDNNYLDEEFIIIDVLDNPEKIIDRILSCEMIASSSLHGIIASQSYGIPSSWVKFSDKIGGDGVKYLDYFESVSCSIDSPIDCRSSCQGNELLEKIAPHIESDFKIDALPLIESCPFDINKDIFKRAYGI